MLKERGWRRPAWVVVFGFRCFYESYQGALLVFVYDVRYFHFFFFRFHMLICIQQMLHVNTNISSFRLRIRNETQINVKSEPKWYAFYLKQVRWISK